MIEYPYTTSQILTDSRFVMYGGQIGTSTSQQREAAYLLAEDQMTEHLNSFLVHTIITGSINHVRDNLFITDFGHVQEIYGINLVVVKQLSPLMTEVHTGSALIKNAEHGLIEVFTDCTSIWMESASAVYKSGLSSGTSTQPAILTALTLAAQINLNEMDVSLANEGVADIGVQRFSNQAYSEERKHLLNTVFGNSATAQRIARLVKRYRSRPGLGL